MGARNYDGPTYLPRLTPGHLWLVEPETLSVAASDVLACLVAVILAKQAYHHVQVYAVCVIPSCAVHVVMN